MRNWEENGGVFDSKSAGLGRRAVVVSVWCAEVSWQIRWMGGMGGRWEDAGRKMPLIHWEAPCGAGAWSPGCALVVLCAWVFLQRVIFNAKGAKGRGD